MNEKKSFFIDSNIIIETFKRNGLKDAFLIWQRILDLFLEHDFFINLVVKNEVAYHLYVKRKLLSIEDLRALLKAFKNLPIVEEIEDDMLRLMENYNLKPNDALILATCKYYQVPYLVSLDTDFEEPCKGEGVTLINTLQRFEEILKTQ